MSDETRQFSPFDDDDDDQTRVQQNHPDDATVVTPRPDVPTRPDVPARPDATAVMPGAQAGDWAADDAAWAGRAKVRAPRPSQDDWATSSWDGAPPPPPGESSRKWWMPIVVGIVALILLGALGWGIYLISSAEDGDTEPAAPSAPATATTQAPETTEPTTTAPTTTPPTTTAATTEPADTEIAVPALVGLSQEEAQQALVRRGLTFRVIVRNGEATPGTVIDSDPPEGQEVPSGTTVTLVVAAERTTPPTSPTTTPTTG
jgi:cytoskeletal protein RodZ